MVIIDSLFPNATIEKENYGYVATFLPPYKLNSPVDPGLSDKGSNNTAKGRTLPTIKWQA